VTLTTLTLCESQHGLRAPSHSTACSSRARPEHRASTACSLPPAYLKPNHTATACALPLRGPESRCSLGPTARWQEALSARPRASKSQSRTNPKSHNPPEPTDLWGPGPTGLWTLKRSPFCRRVSPVYRHALAPVILVFSLFKFKLFKI